MRYSSYIYVYTALQYQPAGGYSEEEAWIIGSCYEDRVMIRVWWVRVPWNIFKMLHRKLLG